MNLHSLRNPRSYLAILVLLLGAIYLGNSDGEIMFDDSLQVHLVRSYQSLSEVLSVDCFDLFRPVKNLVFYLWVSYLPDQIQIWRVSAILIFLGLIPLAYRFFGLFFKNKPWSQLLCTAAWATAPVSTTVVSWISSVNIIICAYGFFAYFILYEKAQNDASEKRIHASYFALCLSLLSLVVACFSYEAAMTAPFLCFLKDFLQHPKRYRSSHPRIFYGLSLLVLGVYFVIRGMYGGANTIDYALAIPTDSSIWISLSSGWFYIIHALRWIYPFGQQGLSIVFIPEEQKALVIISAFIVVNLGIFIVWLRTRQPRLALGLAWYAISLFPMANVVPLKNGPICDYYLFFPSIGLVLVGAELYRLLKQTRYQNLLLGTSVAWLGLFIITTALWVPHWKSRTALAERTLEWQTDNYVMLAFLGEEALLEGDLESSKPLLEKALQDAPIDLKYRHHIEYLLALWAGKSGQLNEAASQLESILESHRSSNTTPPIHYLVQAAYIYDVHLDQTRKAESYLKSALDTPWDGNFSKDAAIRLADIYIKTHRTSQAIELLGFLAANYPGNDEIIQKFRAIQGIVSINSPTHFAVQEK